MAFVVSEAQQSLPDAENKLNLNYLEARESQKFGTVSSQLHLKTTAQDNPSKSIDKQVILKRIRHRRSLNKIQNAFQALSPGGNNHQKWLDPEDAFSCP